MPVGNVVKSVVGASRSAYAVPGAPTILAHVTGVNASSPIPHASASVVIGPSGVNGTSLHVGFGAPASTLGIVGDSYVDRTSSLLHQKTIIGWDTGSPFGSSGGTSGLVPVAFTFGDATPKIIATLSVPMLISEAEIGVTVPFNGTSPALSLGVVGAPQSLIAANQTDPLTAVQYTTSPNLFYPAGTQIILTIVPGAGCTQGAGVVVISALPA